MRRLPTVKYGKIEYFVDERLHEFRSNTRPIQFVPFDSKKGQKIQRYGLSEEMRREMKRFILEELDKLGRELQKRRFT